MDKDKKVILFGAGQIGRQALAHFGRERVLCFVDNNRKKSGMDYEETPVISFSQLKEMYEGQPVILSMNMGNSLVAAKQLEEAGIHHYKLFLELIQQAEQSRASAVQNAEALQAAGDGNRVLMIAYQFPPLSGSGVFRSIKFAKYLPEFNWLPMVISTDRPRLGWNYSDESILQEIPSNVGVIRIPDPMGASCEAPSADREKELLTFLGGILRHDEQAYRIYSALMKTELGRAQLITFPCGMLSWAYDVVMYVEKNLDIHQFKAVYTTADPYSAHLVGFCLREKYGIPWAADYRDPWTGSPMDVFDYENPRDQLFFDLESLLLRTADRSIAVEEHWIQDYVERFGIPESRLAAITNGYDEEDFSGFEESSEEKPDKFIINYSGILHTDPRIAVFSVFLETVQELIQEGALDADRVRLRLTGDMEAGRDLLQKYDWGDVLVQTGYLSHAEALQSNLNASLLLLPIGDGDAMKYVHSGKFFEYLRSGTPILAIAPEDGVVAQMLRETGHGQAFRSTRTAEIKAFILREYHRWRSGGKREALHSPRIHQFERKYLTGQLACILNEVSQ